MYNENQKSITEWAVQTFGRPDNALELLERATVEFSELLRISVQTEEDEETTVSVEDVMFEIADVIIILSQIIEHFGGDLQQLIDDKMAINRARKWTTNGKGVGQHVDEEGDVRD